MPILSESGKNKFVVWFGGVLRIWFGVVIKWIEKKMRAREKIY